MGKSTKKSKKKLSQGKKKKSPALEIPEKKKVLKRVKAGIRKVAVAVREKKIKKKEKSPKVRVPDKKETIRYIAEVESSVSKSGWSYIRETMLSVKDYLWKELFQFEMDVEKAAKLKFGFLDFMKMGFAASVLVFSVVAMIVVVELVFDSRILPNTRVAGIDISYMSYKKAEAVIIAGMDKFKKTPLVFVYDKEKVSLTPEELGIKFDPGQRSDRMLVFGFQNSNILELAFSFAGNRDLSLGYSLDREKIIALLENRFKVSAMRAKNAMIALKDNDFVVLPESPGVKIETSGLFAKLDKDIKELGGNQIAVSLESEYAQVSAKDLEKEKDRLLGMLGKPVSLVSGEKKLTVKFIDHLEAVQYKKNDSGKVVVALNPEKIVPFLNEKILNKIEIPTSPVKIAQNKDGKISIEGKAEDGISVAKDELVKNIASAVNTGKEKVEIKTVIEKAPIDIDQNLKKLGIANLIATGHTSYYGSPPNRMHNIKVGTAKYNGIMLKPGEIFSFNDIVGEVDGRNGFLMEKVIKKNKIELEMGGGLCQVSTTAYRAALLAGLPIVERAPHSWKVAYYGQVLGHGLDATVYTGVRDFRFSNDTPGHLLIQAYVDGANSYFKIYGTDDGRIAKLEGPYGSGLHYKWYRLLTKNNVETKETITADYKPIPPPEPEKPKTIAQNLKFSAPAN